MGEGCEGSLWCYGLQGVMIPNHVEALHSILVCVCGGGGGANLCLFTTDDYSEDFVGHKSNVCF